MEKFDDFGMQMHVTTQADAERVCEESWMRDVLMLKISCEVRAAACKFGVSFNVLCDLQNRFVEYYHFHCVGLLGSHNQFFIIGK